jgi:hypothetical protein
VTESKPDPIADAVKDAQSAKQERVERDMEATRQAPVKAQMAAAAAQEDITAALADLNLHVEPITDFAKEASARAFAMKHPTGFLVRFRIVAHFFGPVEITVFAAYGNRKENLHLDYVPDREVFRKDVAKLRARIVELASYMTS